MELEEWLEKYRYPILTETDEYGKTEEVTRESFVADIFKWIKLQLPKRTTRNSFEMIDWSDDEIDSWNAYRHLTLKNLEIIDE